MLFEFEPMPTRFQKRISGGGGHRRLRPHRSHYSFSTCPCKRGRPNQNVWRPRHVNDLTDYPISGAPAFRGRKLAEDPD